MQKTSDLRDPLDPRAAGAVHDFNNLLSVIMVCADEIAAMPGGGLHRERAEEIRTAASRGAELIRELLAVEEASNGAGVDGRATGDLPNIASAASDLAETEDHEATDVRITRGRPDSTESLEIEVATATALPLLQRSLGDDVSVRTSFDGRLPTVQLPGDALERILLNLAANSRAAFDHAQPASRSVVIQASLVAVRDGDPLLESGWYVRTAFSDNGGGMDYEVAARALEPGFSTKRAGGTGLGLSIVGQIVREAGGDVRLNTTPGVGTTITLYMPAAPSEAEGADYDDDQINPAARGRRPAATRRPDARAPRPRPRVGG